MEIRVKDYLAAEREDISVEQRKQILSDVTQIIKGVFSLWGMELADAQLINSVDLLE